MSKNINCTHTAIQAKYPQLAEFLASDKRVHILPKMVRDELYLTSDKLSEMFDVVLDDKRSVDVLVSKFKPSEVLKKLNREDYDEYMRHWINDQIVNGEMFEISSKSKTYTFLSKEIELKLADDYSKSFPCSLAIQLPAYLAEELEITLGKGTKEFSAWIVDAIERKLSRESMRG